WTRFLSLAVLLRHRGQSLTARTVRAGRDDHVSGRDQSEVDELWALGRSINEDDVVPPGHGLQRLGESRTREVAANESPLDLIGPAPTADSSKTGTDNTGCAQHPAADQ